MICHLEIHHTSNKESEALKQNNTHLFEERWKSEDNCEANKKSQRSNRSSFILTCFKASKLEESGSRS